MKRYLPLLVIASCTLGVWLSGLHHYLSFGSLRVHHLTLQGWVQETFWLSLLLYILLHITVVALSLPVSMFLMLSAGFLFGPWVGTVLSILSATVGGTFLFLATRYASQKPLKPLGKRFQRLQKGFQENALSYLISLRLMPMFPPSFVTIASALLKVPLETFVMGTLIGTLPICFIWVCVGNAFDTLMDQPTITIQTIMSPQVVWALTALGILALFPTFYRRFQKTRKQKDKTDLPL